MGAPRLCPRCGTPVDERRARGLAYCLQCGAPLGSGAHGMSPVGAQSSSKGISPLVWILVGGGVLLVLLGGGIVIAAILVAKRTPVDPPVLASVEDAGGANLETKDDDAGASATGKKPAPSATRIAGTAPTVVPTPTTSRPPPFPRARANADVDRVIQGAQSCHVTGDPVGTGSIRVDFEPDGRVGTVTRRPFAFTTTGECVAARLRAIRLGPFDGTRAESIETTFIIKGAAPTPSSTTGKDGGR